MDTIIVEDEKSSQDLLLQLLKDNFSEIIIKGVAQNIEDAESIIESEKPDLVFMDVILGQRTCFDLLENLGEIKFDIIFTSSYEKYAIKAFRLSAVDYLLKPIVPEELKEALDKVMNKRVNKNSINHIKLLLNNINKGNEHPRIALPTLTGFTLLEVSNIVYCESDNTYTTFFTRDGKNLLVSKTLKSCEKMLSEFSFFRVHNSSLVNMEYIKEYVKGEGGIVIMEGGEEIGVSRRRKDEFLRQFDRIKL